MADAFDAYQYLGYLKSRWRFLALASIVAVSGSLAITLLLPKRYTATARILIEPPAGPDARGAMVISPIYLESLKTYEHIASSDSLFLRVLDRFRLRDVYGGTPIESIKKRVLEVEIPRNTKILEIRATLPDPKLAQALAGFVAEETVSLNRSVASESDRDSASTLGNLHKDAGAALARAQTAHTRFAAERPSTDELAGNIESMQQNRMTIQRQILAADLDAAEKNASFAEGARGRGELLRKRLEMLETGLNRSQRLLAERRVRQARLESELKSAQQVFDRAESRLNESRAEAGSRREQLRTVDPGIVPERPSFPNLPLNVAAALLLGTLGSVVYLSIEFGHRQRRAPTLARMPRAERTS